MPTPLPRLAWSVYSGTRKKKRERKREREITNKK